MRSYKIPSLADVKRCIKKNDSSKSRVTYLYFHGLIREKSYSDKLIAETIKETLQEGLTPDELSFIGIEAVKR